MPNKKYKVVDLFCGCGGISRGFEWSGRFGTQFGVEIMPHPAAAFSNNIKNIDNKEAQIFTGDIEILSKNPKMLWSELNKSGIYRPGDIDVLTGGPPCQGFSRNGVRQYDLNEGIRFYDDPRNHLYRSFLSVVEQTKPKTILIENVREFLNFNQGKFSKDLVLKLGELGYEVSYKKICAAEYGVPQIRWRVFFVAIRKDVADITGIGPRFPRPSFNESDNQLSLISEIRPYRTVRDAIEDLPSPPYGRSHTAIPYSSKNIQSDFARELRSSDGAVFNHYARKLSPTQVARINAVGSGRMKHISPELQTGKFYGSAYRRLSWDEPSLTITTWVYHVGSGQFAHPVEDRGITMREAARLQSFDDDFIFPALVNPVSQMIGNAVPPMVAYNFALIYSDILDRFHENYLRSTSRSVA